MSHSVDSNELLAALLAQQLDRQQRGEPVELSDCILRFPEIAQELQELWGAARLADELAACLSAAPAADPDLSSSGGSPQLPRPFGDYELLTELGRGGKGVVYQARQNSLGRIVAIKMMLGGTLETPQNLARFRIEAAAAARLDHPHIVSVFEVGEVEGQAYYSMPCVEGTTLARRIAHGLLSNREAAQLMLPICRAISHAHSHGVLHRDLKPSNILIDHQGQPFVSDFGLAKQVSAGAGGIEATALTHSGDILGTPGYMAPEQAIGARGEVGPGTDVYSLGAVLYACVTGRPPFQAATPLDTVLMILQQDPLSPRLLNPGLDADLEMIILKAMQRPLDLRYSSAAALADDLQAYLNHEPIAARSSHFTQVLSRFFRPTHHIGVLENWGLLWMWHAVVLLTICLITNAMQISGVDSRLPYLGLWTVGLGAWAVIFWNLRHRSGPVTFVERQIAHIWAASMAMSTALYGVEYLLDLPVLKLSLILPLIAGSVFIAKAGILSGEFYVHAVLLFLATIPMAAFPAAAISIFGLVSAATFAVPGWKFYRLQQMNRRSGRTVPA